MPPKFISCSQPEGAHGVRVGVFVLFPPPPEDSVTNSVCAWNINVPGAFVSGLGGGEAGLSGQRGVELWGRGHWPFKLC